MEWPRPLLLVDVDGVLNPFAAKTCPDGYQEYDFFPGEELVRLSLAHGEWLRDLAARFDVIWATGWGEEANQFIGPLLSLPAFPTVTFPPVPFDPCEKLPAVQAFVGDRPFAWIDDALTPETWAWAARRVPHAAGMHGIQVLPGLAWLLSFTTLPGVRQQRLVRAACAGYLGIVLVSALQTFGGLAPWDLRLGTGALFLASVLLLATPVVTGLRYRDA